MAAVWLLGERATVLRCAAATLLVGVALTTKFSGILALPMLGIALLCRVMIDTPWSFFRWTLFTRLRRLVAAAGVFAGVFKVAEGFVFTVRS